jgi:hypothetical protein
MKYLKKFDNYTPQIINNSLLPKDSKFKIGDYIIIKFGKSYSKYQKKIFIAKSYHEDTDLWELVSELPSIRLYYPTKYLRKATKKEIEAHEIEIAAKKYNL